MAHIESEGGSKRRGSTQLNLVPFIDLMSVLIIFLLITAVWSQVSMIQMGSSVFGKKNDNIPTPIEPTPHSDVLLRIDVKSTGYVVMLGKDTFQIPKQGETMNREELMAHLQRAKELYPEKVDAQITMNDDLAYEELIIAMDTIIKAGFTSPQLPTGGN
jgi:biopolymer transport protein ExbD